MTKAGTPTMGGVAIVVAALVGYVVAHVRPGLVFTRSGLLVMLAIVGAGVVGLIDDWIKVSSERNLGLNKTAKIVGLLVRRFAWLRCSSVAVERASRRRPAAPCSLHTSCRSPASTRSTSTSGTFGWAVLRRAR